MSWADTPIICDARPMPKANHIGSPASGRQLEVSLRSVNLDRNQVERRVALNQVLAYCAWLIHAPAA